MTQAWRSKKYHCIHIASDGDSFQCSQGLCDADDVFECCASCSEYQGRDRGLGDTIKRATEKVGIKTCGKCQKRREALNKLSQRLYEGLKK